MRVGYLGKAVAVVATVVWMSGCSSTSTSKDSLEKVEPVVQQPVVEAVKSTPVVTDTSMQMSEADKAKAALAKLQTVFYFEFDKAVVKAEAFEDLSAHARYLANNADARLVLEGHADERGTREYNMALGERRAKAIARFLAVQGAGSNQVEVVSYGEERPAVMGHDENSWGMNRRVELKYSR